MIIKIFQLNILCGEYLNNIIEFIKQEKPDIVQLQEVAGGNIASKGKDTYAELKKNLNYNAELVVQMREKNSYESYEGNATFFLPYIKIIKKSVVWLKDYSLINSFKKRTNEEIINFPRCALSLLLEINKKQIYFINTHLAWGSTSEDKPYKLMQAEKLVSYIKVLDKPFILTGDFNLDPSSKVVSWFEEIGSNLNKKYVINNTLNPAIHYRAKHLFPPGLVVDYIFIHPSIKDTSYRAVEESNLSDHLGLLAEVEI